MSEALAKIAGVDLATVIQRAALSPEGTACVEACAEVSDAIARLEGAGLAVEAIRVLAHALPKREAVWWACMCAGTTAPPDLAEPDRLARETAELWVRQQKEEIRRAAMKHAETAGFQTPEA